MKHYPTIPTEIQMDTSVWVFDKIDGSNIRAEWNSKKGFYKFGSRKQLIDPGDKLLGKSINLIKQDEEKLSSIFKSLGFKQVICYYEFYGLNSFAGQHDLNDVHQVVLLDVEVHNKGYMSPKDYLKAFGGIVNIPTLLHQGYLTEAIVEAIRAGEMPGMGGEGVVCKAPSSTGHGHHLNMFKIKRRSWLEAVKAKYGKNYERYI